MQSVKRVLCALFSVENSDSRYPYLWRVTRSWNHLSLFSSIRDLIIIEILFDHYLFCFVLFFPVALDPSRRPNVQWKRKWSTISRASNRGSTDFPSGMHWHVFQFFMHNYFKYLIVVLSPSKLNQPITYSLESGWGVEIRSWIWFMLSFWDAFISLAIAAIIPVAITPNLLIFDSLTWRVN